MDSLVHHLTRQVVSVPALSRKITILLPARIEWDVISAGNKSAIGARFLETDLIE